MVWDVLYRLGAETGTVRALNLGCSLAARLLGTELPAEAMKRIAGDRMTARLAARAASNLVAVVEQPHSFVKNSIFHLLARERWRDRIRYCFRVWFVPTPSDEDALRLPPGLSALYYPFHTGRMFVKYGLGSLRRPN